MVQARTADLVLTARDAFNKGFTKNMRYRVKNLKNFIKFLEENETAIVEAMSDDLRKHREEARLEVFVAINHLKYLIDNVRTWSEPDLAAKRWTDLLDGLYIYHDPLGVVLVMGAWNVPLLTLVPVTGAMAAGNCVVIKPSHTCPSFGKTLARLLPKYIDPICYPVFLGGVEETNELLEQRFDYIYYTGGATVGKIVHRAANKYLTPITLELGGKNPVFVDASADLELTATRVMWGKCFNSGQACIAPDYVLCTKQVEKEFIQHARSALTKFFNNDPRCCPIVNDFHFRRLQKLLRGLNVVIGGRVDPLDNYIEPTVVTGVTPADPIMQEEIFGPILPIITVSDFKDAVNFINKGEKPLALYVFTKNAVVRDYIIDNTSSGGVTVNDTLMHLIVESLPFGGVGLSGMGCYKGKDSFDTFVHKKSVLVKNFSRIIEKVNEMRYPPYSSRKTDILAFLLKYRRGLSWIWVFYFSVFLIGFLVGFLFFNYFALVHYMK
ncbi:aldehyde dehydrogenase family 3 member B1 [Tribolium castaneum]|uniref:Aldehyde dehydrogenase n=1 Tax=Tribolium castaneum TaxID=7070 RepID=D6WX67_TRICA|nr:PREDICTED: aldehyde dehydrogenase family 3 member B1 [Tribolium castaneum]XP_008197103.1 PREDICTED: aldehyde dehydrogenase family 3 member B1 [Tribolium castaneum]XP_015838077.1 PREDICTED: aldehyde dehydrogenase family 3 member B1 [Tribolium castaneum]EFA08035.1 Aldehyde dehydrogenase family 3 member B1-like Protein [Tribolium castaneum]|eukprot:XP_008197102.1 PREDICTED: aldehyde dehydrogenase family 3 member B1 [Tribolium castaneum]